MIWQERAAYGYYEQQHDLYGEIELIFGDLTENGFSQEIVDYFSAFQELANNPENTSQRVVLRDTAVSLTNELNRFHDQLMESIENINLDISQGVSTINTYTQQIAELNEDIVAAEAAGDVANDLRDQRDLLIDGLSEVATVSVNENIDGSVSITMEGYTLVNGESYNELRTVEENAGGYRVLNVVGSDLENIELGQGILAADMEIRDQEIPELLEMINECATTLIQEVNEIHRQGYGLGEPPSTGIDFFQGTDAQSIRVNPAIIDDVSLIAASSDGTPGNGDVALQIADLQYQDVLEGDTMTFTGHFNTLLSSVGSSVDQAGEDVDRQLSVLTLLENRRSSQSAVSLNEENVNLILQQNAFEAAARLIEIVDELMDEVLNIAR
jgi:flagellar hook-associated protein 1 FlgK